MKSIFLRLLPCVVALLLIGGCVLSEQPLSAIQDAQPDLRLVGTWHEESETESKQDIRVSYDPQGLGHLSKKTGSNPSPSKPNDVTFFVTKTDKASYLNVLILDGDKQNEKGKHYQFYKYTVSEDQKILHLWTTKIPTFQKAVRESKLKGQLESADGSNPEQQSVVLQDSSEAILRFLETLPPEEAFTDFGVSTKVD